MKNSKKIIYSSIVTIVAGLILYYLLLPAINIQYFGFWIYLAALMGIFAISIIISYTDKDGKVYSVTKNGILINRLPKISTIIGSSIFAIVIVIVLINFVLSPLFFSKDYSKRITVDETNNFIEDVKPVDFKSIPLLDKDSSQKLGDRVMGQMPELVSQFYVSDIYTQINYNNEIIRVTPLEYDGFIKYFTNRKDGVKGYITVNSVTGESKLVKLDKGMKYMPSALFNENLYRHVRFSYPTEIFGEASFELDNDGNPYWIIPTMSYTGVGLRQEVSGVIITDPITGESKNYKVKDVPKWVDHVYSANVILEQVNDWGKYKNGFINSLFGQKNVVTTTEGYNYTVMNDDVYLYTGITSATSDEASLGFILTNMRTKETHFYATPGAKEYSAMDSAKGQVQQMKYSASFPLLINLNNRPTYLISLKDNAGLVKMYAFVDVVDYQKVVVTDAAKGIEKAADNYLNGIDTVDDESKYITKEIKIATIQNANIEGTSYYYIIDTLGKKYKVSIKVNQDKIPFLSSGDTIKVSFNKEKDVTEILKMD